MEFQHVVFSGHAVQRMFERKISENDVIQVLKLGEVIEDYPNDYPYSSSLILGFIETQPIHVVAALDQRTKTCYIVTVYIPDPNLWHSDFRGRRSK